MTLLIMYFRIVGIIIIAIGCIFLTQKKIIIKQQYFIVFICTFILGAKAIDPSGGTFVDPYGFVGNIISPIPRDQYLLIITSLYLFIVIISFITMKGRYGIENIKIETLIPAITNVLDEKGIVYEVIDDSVVLTNFDNKKIECRELLNSTVINFSGIIGLPFYGDVKDRLISKVKLIKERVFPTMGVFWIMMGIILIVTIQLLTISN